MKILVYIAIWKRPEVTRICFEGVKRLIKNSNHQINCYCVVSEDWAEVMCEEFGFEYKRVKNEPLGHKMNRGLYGAMKYKWDYIMTLGSDDLISDELLKIYEPYMNKGIGLIGIDKVYFADLKNKKTKLVDYDLQIVGAGRLISREAIKDTATRVRVTVLQGCSTIINSYYLGQITYMPQAEVYRLGAIVSPSQEKKFELWDGELMCTLDNNSNNRLIMNHVSNKCIEVGEVPLIVDIKTDENLWDYDSLDGTNKDFNLLNDFRELRQESDVSVES
ncbi:MAG: hypothetical protein JKY53_14865 [Flavobacteriales bacterium]|nr:hypothetical protein [Flavobacteriales bacterium]